MSRHLDNLDRLCNDLNSRYGELDPMVQQVKAEVEAHKVKETSEQTPHNRAMPYRKLVKDRDSELMRQISN
jgi:hypothetical protein